MTALRRAWVAAAALASGCHTVAAQERPAVIVAPSETSRAELERAVSAAFNGQPVILAADALTRESVLIVERREPRDAEGRPLRGRVLERPERFRLVLNGSVCELVRESDGQRIALMQTTCAPYRDAGSR